MGIDEWFDFGGMDLDLSSIAVSLMIYSLLMLIIWKGWGSGNWTMGQKMIITIVMLPMSYVMVAWQLNK